jgi:hypothetical protein
MCLRRSHTTCFGFCQPSSGVDIILRENFKPRLKLHVTWRQQGRISECSATGCYNTTLLFRIYLTMVSIIHDYIATNDWMMMKNELKKCGRKR